MNFNSTQYTIISYECKVFSFAGTVCTISAFLLETVILYYILLKSSFNVRLVKNDSYVSYIAAIFHKIFNCSKTFNQIFLHMCSCPGLQ